MLHSEINNSPDMPMRFIQMWFIPSEKGLNPSVEQKAVEREERTNRLLPIVSNEHKDALPIHSDAQVYSCFLRKGHECGAFPEGRSRRVYICAGGRRNNINGNSMPVLGAAQVMGDMDIHISADGECRTASRRCRAEWLVPDRRIDRVLAIEQHDIQITTWP